jgi:C-22 sterol desaturase
MAVNASFASPTADATVAHLVKQLDSNSVISAIVNGFSLWRLVLTVLVMAIAYDQCTNSPCI